MATSRKINSRYLRQWAPAMAFALLLNLFLVCLIPVFIDTVPDQPENLISLNAVNVFRVTPMEPPERKQPPPPLPEPEQRMIKREPVLTAPSVPRNIRLPFELNPRLPSGPQSLKLPPLEMIDLKVPENPDACDAADIDSPLVPLSKVPPMYPLRARRMGIEGWVSVRFMVNDNGSVGRIEITGAEPKGVFEQSVLRCVARWRFQPGTIEGIPVRTWAETTIYFKLENGS